MTPKAPTCASCILADTPGCTGFMPTPEGKGLIPLLIIGEALGEAEAKDSLPFRPYAESGSLLERAFRSIGIQREQLIVTNLIHCRPPNNRLAGEYYEQPAVDHCRQYLDAEIAKFKPRVILALGATPFKYLTGSTGRGKQTLDYMRGYALDSIWYPGIPVISTYHPSYIRRGATELFPVLVHDLNQALQLARGRRSWPIDEQVTYQAGGVPELQNMLDILLRDPNRLIAYDLETRESTTEDEDKYDGLSMSAPILSFQFSISPNTGLSVPWDEQTIPLIERILRLPNPISGHNSWTFDLKQLAAKGITLPRVGRDTMQAFHHLYSDLPANLQFVASLYGAAIPWKHTMSQDFLRYGAIDVDMVQRIESRVEQDLRSKHRRNLDGTLGISCWEGYEQYTVGVRPILADMERHGLPRDRQACDELEQYIEQEKALQYAEIQAACPEEIKPVKTWVIWPEDIAEAKKAYAEANLVTPISEKTGKPLKPRVPIIKLTDAVAIPELARIIESAGYIWSKDAKGIFKRLPFSPLATEHLKRYLRFYKIVVPTSLDDEETTGRAELDKLMKRLESAATDLPTTLAALSTWKATFDLPNDRNLAITHVREFIAELRNTARTVFTFIERVLTYRKLHKVVSTYITGWDKHLGSDGRIHTTFTFAPATGQLSSRGPCVQNSPKGKSSKDLVGTKLAKLFRKTIYAEPGHLIIEADYSGCHVLTMGFEAEAPNYVRLGRLDAHSFLAAHMVRSELRSNSPAELADLDTWLDLPDDQLKAKLNWVKKNYTSLRNDKAKVAVLGNQLGLGSKKLYDQNMDSFKNEAEAKAVQTILKNLFPEIPRFQQRIRKEAALRGELISRYGFIRRFSEVEKYSAKANHGAGGMISGLDAEAAGAFDVQNDAHGKLREAMLDLRAEGLDTKYGLCNTVHDSLVFHCKLEYVAEAVVKIAEIMERPAKRLTHPTLWPEGLKLGVEVSVGVNWGEISEVKISNGRVEAWPESVRGLLS